LLWKTEGIPSGPDGGVGSIVVADGRAFVFVNSRRPKSPNGKVVFTAEVLSELGWAPGVPKDLAAKIEAARLSEKRAGLTEAGINDYVRDFLATIDSSLAAKFGSHIRGRLTKGRDALAWDALVKLAAYQGHEFLPIEESFKASIKTGAEFAAQDEFNKVMNDIFGGYGTDAAKQQVARALFRYTDFIVCLDAATGRQLWKSQEFPGSAISRWEATNHWGASGTPAILGGKCYVAGSAGFYCLDVKDGSVAWQAKTRPSNSSPLVALGLVFFMNGGQNAFDGELTALSAQTGKRVWTQPKVQSANSSVAQWTTGDKSYLLCCGHGGTYCVEPQTGEVRWQAPGGWSGDSTPVIVDDCAVVYTGHGMQTFRITPEKAELIWERRLGDDRGASPLVYRGSVYAIGGKFGRGGPAIRCFDLRTGEVKWQQKMDDAECASPLLADGKIIANVGQSWFPMHTIMFRPSAERFEKLGETPPGAVATCSSPAVADGKLYLRMDGAVGCYDLTSAGNNTVSTTVKLEGIENTSSPDRREGEAARPRFERIPFPISPGTSAAGAKTASPPPTGWRENWPQFRGPSGDGAAAAGAAPRTADLRKAAIYSTAIPAKGHSSPIVWGERIFLTGEGDRIMAFDRASGKLLWNTMLKSADGMSARDDDGFKTAGNDTGMAAPTACTDGKQVYAFFGNGLIGCVTVDGRQVWAKRLVRSKPRNTYGLAASPVLYGDLVIQVLDQGASHDDNLSFIVALRTTDGSVAWGQDRPVRSGWSTPLVVRDPNGDELVTTGAPWVIAYEPTTGRELWRARELSGDVAPSPVAKKGLLYASSGDGGSGMLAIRTGGRGDVTKTRLAWTADLPTPDASSPVCDGRRYFHISSGGELCCRDATSGKEVWTKNLPGQYWASPVLADDCLYVVNTGGEMSVISVTDGQKQSTLKLQDMVTTSPAILGGRIYVRTIGHLACIGSH
jgi:outer membrane protein assembly factor BamB